MSAQIESYEEISREGLVDMLEEATGRIAALEADKKRLVEALEDTTRTLEVWKYFFPNAWDLGDENAVTTSRALLSEVS